MTEDEAEAKRGMHAESDPTEDYNARLAYGTDQGRWLEGTIPSARRRHIRPTHVIDPAVAAAVQDEAEGEEGTCEHAASPASPSRVRRSTRSRYVI